MKKYEAFAAACGTTVEGFSMQVQDYAEMPGKHPVRDWVQGHTPESSARRLGHRQQVPRHVGATT